MYKIIKSKQDAREFLVELQKSLNEFLFNNKEVERNVCHKVLTRIRDIEHDQFSIYSYWIGGSDIMPEIMSFQEAAKYVWQHRKDINDSIRKNGDVSC
ncbi:hypothetical protein [Thermoanaerobacterium thermosaccharolyticum]|uniref:hypothetical protein n=1 Tax=Thermoanaerobacterium thermosaccharolyticum TaxID=1517 RepID=UPI003DA7D3D2